MLKLSSIEKILITIVLCMSLATILTQCATQPAEAQEVEYVEEEDVALWLARSCLGEVGWKVDESDECTSILFVYLKISKRTGKPLLDIAKMYSAAIKPRINHPRKWVLNITREAEKPNKWPVGSKWTDDNKNIFLRTLANVDAFLQGDLSDPTGCATHYGGPKDPPSPLLEPVKTPDNYKNVFYKLKNKKCGGV